jgi:hypothetical protein
MIPGILRTDGKRERSKRGELQRMLGELGEVLPRQNHGTPQRPAQGWYARIASSGEVVFLGDYHHLAGAKLAQLVEQLSA